MRARLLFASAVLLTFTAIVGALGLRAAGQADTRAERTYELALQGEPARAALEAQHAATAASAASARTTAQLALVGALLGGFGLALWFAGGFQRSLRDLTERAEQCDREAAELRRALEAAAGGDLTVELEPLALTAPRADALAGAALGSLGRHTQASVKAYNTLRAHLAETIGALAGGAGTVAAASLQMAATSDETGRAVTEIAVAVGEVAAGAARQVRRVEATREAVKGAARSAQTSAEVAAATVQAAGDARAVALEGVDAANSASEAMRERRTLYSWLDSGTLARGPDLLAQISGTVTGERMRASDLMQSGRYAESLDAARSAIHLARRFGNTYEEIRASVMLGVGLAMTGAVADGVSILGQALQDALRREDDETTITTQINLSFVLLVDGQWQEAARVALQGLEDAEKRGTSGADGALLAPNAAEALIRLGRLAQATRILKRALDADPPPAVSRVLLLSLAEADVLSARFSDADAALRSIAAGGGLDDFQFQQQMSSVEAELQLWHPSAGHAVALDDLRRSLGSSLSDVAGEDLPLAARSFWLGVRADADAATVATLARDDHRVSELADDALRLQQSARALQGRALSGGVRAQLDRFIALIAAEVSRLRGSPAPDLWRAAEAAAAGDAYLHSYSLWRLGSSLRAVHRRRDAGVALREAYGVADDAGLRVIADAVTVAGHSLGIRVDRQVVAPTAAPRPISPFNLTPRELEVLALLVQGFTNRRIARALGMAEKTASVHVSRILGKLSVSGRGEAVARAYEVGLASVTDE